jgi:thiamine-phosphate pyrophosphorylase
MLVSEPANDSARRERLAGARLYLVLPCAPPDTSAADARTHGERLVRVTLAAIAGGVDIVQLREKHADQRELLGLASELARACAQRGALFIVNDSPALALESGADGVHVGQEDMPVAEARAIVGSGMVIGLSTHARAEIDAAHANTADGSPLVDYIGVGPVYETPTKPGRPAVGTGLVSYASTHASVPFFAIGGLHSRNLHEVLDAGATRAVILRAIAEAEDPEQAARQLRVRLDNARAERA